MNIQPDTALLDEALNYIAQASQYVLEPQTYREKRILLADIRAKADEALLAFTAVERDAILAAAKEG